MNIEIFIALIVLVGAVVGFLLWQRKRKENKRRTIPESHPMRLPVDDDGLPIIWDGDTAHKAWEANGTSEHFRNETVVSITENDWLRLVEIVEEVRGAHAYEANGVQGDWWGKYGFDCKAFALTFKKDALVYLPEGSVRLATCKAGNFYHAVCLVFTGNGVYVMDNQHNKPMPWKSLNYNEWAVETANGEWRILDL